VVSKDAVLYTSPFLIRSVISRQTSGILAEDQIPKKLFIRSALDSLSHEPMMGRIIACRVGLGWIASEKRGLTTAAAKIDLSLWTRLTRLRHPLGAAKAIETFRSVPDRGKRPLSDIFKG
jgi:hypothetical protein